MLYIYLSDTITGLNSTVYATSSFSEQFYMWDVNMLYTLGSHSQNTNVNSLTHTEGLAFCTMNNSAAAFVPTAADFLKLISSVHYFFKIGINSLILGKHRTKPHGTHTKQGTTFFSITFNTSYYMLWG